MEEFHDENLELMNDTLNEISEPLESFVSFVKSVPLEVIIEVQWRQYTGWELVILDSKFEKV